MFTQSSNRWKGKRSFKDFRRNGLASWDQNRWNLSKCVCVCVCRWLGVFTLCRSATSFIFIGNNFMLDWNETNEKVKTNSKSTENLFQFHWFSIIFKNNFKSIVYKYWKFAIFFLLFCGVFGCERFYSVCRVYDKNWSVKFLMWNQ